MTTRKKLQMKRRVMIKKRRKRDCQSLWWTKLLRELAKNWPIKWLRQCAKKFYQVNLFLVHCLAILKKNTTTFLILFGWTVNYSKYYKCQKIHFVHRFIPGVRYTKENTPALQDVVLIVSKEAERSRNIKYHYGRVIETCVEILYRNATEAVNRIIDRNVKDIVLIKGIDVIDFNTESHFLAASIQRKFL